MTRCSLGPCRASGASATSGGRRRVGRRRRLRCTSRGYTGPWTRRRRARPAPEEKLPAGRPPGNQVDLGDVLGCRCPIVSGTCPDTLDSGDTLGHYGAHGPQLRTLRRRPSAVRAGGVPLGAPRQLEPRELRHRRRRRRGRHPRGGRRAASHRQRPQRPRAPRLRRPPELARRLAGGGERMTIAMPTLQTRPLNVLTVFNDIYAEAEHGRFYAYRSDRRHMWRLISREEEFKPVAAKTVEELDELLAAWLGDGAR